MKFGKLAQISFGGWPTGEHTNARGHADGARARAPPPSAPARSRGAWRVGWAHAPPSSRHALRPPRPVDYKGLKRAARVAAYASPGGAAPGGVDFGGADFGAELALMLRAVDETYAAHEAALLAALRELGPLEERAPWGSACERGCARARRRAELTESARTLRSYAVLQYLAALKLVKKHDKVAARPLRARVLALLVGLRFVRALECSQLLGALARCTPGRLSVDARPHAHSAGGDRLQGGGAAEAASGPPSPRGAAAAAVPIRRAMGAPCGGRSRSLGDADGARAACAAAAAAAGWPAMPAWTYAAPPPSAPAAYWARGWSEGARTAAAPTSEPEGVDEAVDPVLQAAVRGEIETLLGGAHTRSAHAQRRAAVRPAPHASPARLRARVRAQAPSARASTCPAPCWRRRGARPAPSARQRSRAQTRRPARQPRWAARVRAARRARPPSPLRSATRRTRRRRCARAQRATTRARTARPRLTRAARRARAWPLAGRRHSAGRTRARPAWWCAERADSRCGSAGAVARVVRTAATPAAELPPARSAGGLSPPGALPRQLGRVIWRMARCASLGRRASQARRR